MTKADAVTLLVSAGTSFNGPRESPGREGRDATAEALRPLEAAQEAPYADLVARHVADHQRLFRRVALDLGSAAGRRRPRPRTPGSTDS